MVMSAAYLLLCIGLALFALRFLQSYIKVRNRGVRASFGLYLFFLFFLLAFGTGSLSALYIWQIPNSFFFQVGTGVALLFFMGAATTGILLIKYMLPRLGRLVGILALFLTFFTFEWVGEVILSNSFSLFAAVERMIFVFFAISLASLAIIVSQFFLLTGNPEVKTKSVALLAFIGALFFGMFEALATAPILQISAAFSSTLIGLLGVLLIGAAVFSATHSAFRLRSKSETSRSVMEFLNAF